MNSTKTPCSATTAGFPEETSLRNHAKITVCIAISPRHADRGTERALMLTGPLPEKPKCLRSRLPQRPGNTSHAHTQLYRHLNTHSYNRCETQASQTPTRGFAGGRAPRIKPERGNRGPTQWRSDSERPISEMLSPRSPAALAGASARRGTAETATPAAFFATRPAPRHRDGQPSIPRPLREPPLLARSKGTSKRETAQDEVERKDTNAHPRWQSAATEARRLTNHTSWRSGPS